MKICKQGSADAIRRKLEQYDEKFKCECCGCKFTVSFDEYRVNYYGNLFTECPCCGVTVHKRGLNDYDVLRELKEAERNMRNGDDSQ